jgi:8-oxo-dGTP pyrophosphatase MutT (NUDIX family)
MLQQIDPNEFYKFLCDRLHHELPGALSHIKLMPKIDGTDYRKLFPEGTIVNASVLIAINQNLNFPLIVRSGEGNQHPNQISLPGGKAENGESSIETALREAQEEINFNIQEYKYAGNLTDLYIEPSKFIVTPEIIFIDEFSGLKPDKHEAEEIFFVNLYDLAYKIELKSMTKRFFEKDIIFPYWEVGAGYQLWGATAMILMELVDLLKEFVDA